MTIIGLFLAPFALLLVVLARSKNRRRDEAVLEAKIRAVLDARFADGKDPRGEILKCDFVETLDDREQRLIALADDGRLSGLASELFVAMDTKGRGRWAKLKHGHDVFESRCRASSKLGSAIADLFAAVDKRSGKTEAAT